MNNNTDITYSFNLDNYINSLESNRPFNDYKILVNNKDYNTLSLEHNRLMNEVNDRINTLDTLSEESFGEAFVSKITAFISWFKDMINRLITMISTFIKRIIAKIYELTLRSKNGLYKQFKSSVFTSVNIPIKDRKLNPNMIGDMEKYTESIRSWNKAFTKSTASILNNEDNYNNHQEFVDLLKENETRLYDLKETGVGNYIDKIFYSEEKKFNTTIREYFGCNAGQTPKQLIILSDEYKEKLIKVKKETENFLKMLKIRRNDFFNYLNKTQSVEDSEKEQIINTYKNIIKNITYFHNMNYTFFIKAVKVRAKVAKYITKASLGNGIVTQMENGIASGKPFIINTYYGMDFETFRIINDNSYELNFGQEKAKIDIINDTRAIIVNCELVKGGELHTILYDIVAKHAIGDWNRGLIPGRGHPDYNLFIDNLIKKIGKGKEGIFQFRQTKDHLEVFPKLQELFKFPIDITKFCTIMTFETGNARSIWARTVYVEGEPKVSFPEGNFRIVLCLGNEKYITTEKDELFHTSSDNMKYLQGLYRNKYLFSEQRIYFGANIPMTPDGLISKNDLKNQYIYKMFVNPGETIYKDPEFYAYKERGEKNRADKTACYILKDKVNIQDVTEWFFNKPEWVPETKDEM